MKRFFLYHIAHFAFVAAALVIVALGWMLFLSSTASRESTHEVGHTLEVISAISSVNEKLSRADSAQRGYMLSGNETFLSERDEALAKARNTASALNRLSADNPEQQRRVTQLEALLANRHAIMLDIAQLRRSGHIEAAARSTYEIGQQANARIYQLTGEIRQEEEQLLALRRADDQRRSKIELTVLIGAVLISLLVLVPGYIGFIRQFRARKQVERKLTAMAESLPGTVYQLRSNPDGRMHYEFVSPSVAQLFGIDREAFFHDSAQLWDRVFEEDKAGLAAAIRKAADSLEPHRHEFRIQHPDGSIKWLSSSALLEPKSDGSILWNGYWADVTQQRQMAQALQEAKEAADTANRAKSVFLATMSHEIRTPMNGVLGMLELFSLSKLDGAQRTSLGVVRESGKSLLRIIDDILDFSKIEAGKLEVFPEVVSIAEMIAAVRNLYSGNASSKGLLIRSSVDPAISPALLVDPMRLRQILNNFLSNALKFTTKGHIEIKAQLIGRANGEERLRFSVQDTGIGISPENQARLFQPFVQATGGTASQFGGTGLGLAICQRLAEMMSGSIEMVSAIGTGTTMSFELSLPIADPKDLVHADPQSTEDFFSTTLSMRRMAPSIAQAEAEGSLLLLVEDHPVNRLVLMNQVNTLGYAAESAENGVEALAMWESGRYAIIITDCNMPLMDGYELAQAIRKIESSNGGTRVPIIACTAYALAGEADTCFTAGMDGYLTKPVELKNLAKILDEWLPIVHLIAPIDRAVLAEHSHGDAAAERKILTYFQQVNDEDAALLQHAVDGADMPRVTNVCHRIKGASMSVGATALAAVCERLEHASRSNDWQSIEANMSAFHHELGRLNFYCTEEKAERERL